MQRSNHCSCLTHKDLLKQEGSALFGRFFVAMVSQAAQERSILDQRDRTPTFVYVDEAQEYFDDSIETILNQARKYRVSLTLAHQTLDQLSPRLRAALNANTSMKCVGGVSAKDARALSEELRTTPEFIEGMRRRGPRTEFAVWLKQMTPHAIRLSVPLGFLERQPLLSEEAFEGLTRANRERYCGTLADVVGFEFTDESPEQEPARAGDRRQIITPSMNHHTSVRKYLRHWALSQDELVRFLNLSQSAASRLERGEVYPEIVVAIGLQVVFGGRPDELFPGLYGRVEGEVMAVAAAMDRELEGKTDRASIRKQQLFAAIVARSNSSSLPR